MREAWIIAGLLVPWVCGAAVVRLTGAGRTLSVGAGWFVGQVMVMAALYAALRLDRGVPAGGMLIAMTIAAVVLWSYAAIRPRPHTPIDPLPDADLRISTTGRLFIGLIAASLAAKLYVMALAHAEVPIRNDDAISIWLFKAKVVASLRSLPMNPAGDYFMGGSNPHYPIFVSLKAAWLPLVAERWDERLATLPWLFDYLAMLILVAGGLRRWLTSAQAFVAAYVVGSLPMLGLHVCRPGYADLPLAGLLASAVMFLLTWRSTGRLADLAMGWLFIVAVACMKREGPLLAAVTAICLIAPSWPLLRYSGRAVRLAMGLASLVGIALVYGVTDFSEQAREAATLRYHPEAWPALARHLFEWSSFGPLFLIVASLVPIIAIARHAEHRVVPILLTLGLCGVPASFFLLTDQVRFALNDQTPSRLYLQVAPAIMVALAAAIGPALAAARQPLNTKAGAE